MGGSAVHKYGETVSVIQDSTWQTQDTTARNDSPLMRQRAAPFANRKLKSTLKA